jgi:DNA polymerase III delta prime subunit
MLLPSKTLYGMPGIGKSTLVELIINELQTKHGFDDQDYLKLNASDARGIDTVRDVIRPFIRHQTRLSNVEMPKILWLEEGEQLTNDAQKALKAELDRCIGTCICYITTNKASDLNDAIIDRCPIMTMNSPDISAIRKRINEIVTTEEIDITPTEIDELITVHYPSIRSMIIDLDQYVDFGKSSFISNNRIAKELFGYIVAGDTKHAFNLTKNRDIDQRLILRILMNLIVQSPDIDTAKQFEYAKILCEGDYKIVVGTMAEIAFRNTVGELVKV